MATFRGPYPLISGVRETGATSGGLRGRLLRADGRISGARFAGAYRAEQLEQARRLGVEVVENADALLDELETPTAAAFDFVSGVIYLRKGATRAEWFHELTHAKQWKELGREAYEAQGRWSRELHQS